MNVPKALEFRRIMDISVGIWRYLGQKQAGAAAGDTVLPANVKGQKIWGEIIEKHN